MTLALAAVCTDGVVIVEDRVLIRMDTYEVLKHDEKLRGVIRNVIFGYAGAENLYDIFVKCVVGELVMLRDDQVQKYTRINMLSKFRSIIDNLRGLSSSLLLKILVARQFPQDGKSDLHLLLETGKAVPVQTWKTIGNGDTVANPLVQDFWKDKELLQLFQGENGPVVAGLFNPSMSGPPTGPINGLLTAATLTSSELTGPLAHKTIDSLVNNR